MKQYRLLRRFGDGDLILEHGFGLGIRSPDSCARRSIAWCGFAGGLLSSSVLRGAASISRNAFQRMARFRADQTGIQGDRRAVPPAGR